MDADLQASYVRAQLKALDTKDLVDYQTHMLTAVRKANSWDLRGVAHLVNGGGSDDSFYYFRAWLVGQGREVFERLIANPDDLADYVGEINLGNEDLIGAASEVHHSRTGSYELTGPVGIEDDATGTRWCDDDLPARLPKTFAKYGGSFNYFTRAAWTMLLRVFRSAIRGVRRSP